MDFCALSEMDPKDMAENMIGEFSSTVGGICVRSFPVLLNSSLSGFEPRKVFVSIGSRSGSIDGLVT